MKVLTCSLTVAAIVCHSINGRSISDISERRLSQEPPVEVNLNELYGSSDSAPTKSSTLPPYSEHYYGEGIHEIPYSASDNSGIHALLNLNTKKNDQYSNSIFGVKATYETLVDRILMNNDQLITTFAAKHDLPPSTVREFVRGFLAINTLESLTANVQDISKTAASTVAKKAEAFNPSNINAALQSLFKASQRA